MTIESTVDLRRAVARVLVARDGDEYRLGRPDLGLYVAVPAAGAAFVTALGDGASLAEATARASEVAGAEVDGVDFLAGLTEAGLLDAPTAGDTAPDTTRPGRRIRWIEGVSERVARPFFGPVAWTGYGIAVAFATGVLLVRPDLRPTFENLWFLDDPLLSFLTYLPIMVLLIAAHEAWHWLAGRAVGVPAVFRVSRRGIWLVFETDLTQIVAVPRRRRYGPFLAGMALDATLLAVALALRLLYHAEIVALPPIADRILAVIVYSQVVDIGLQIAGVFMRTDVYAILANALRCDNLYRATWLTTKARLVGLRPSEATELAAISPHDRRVAAWFGLVYLAGMTGVAWVFLSYGLPLILSMSLWVATNLGTHSVRSSAFWESVAAVTALVALWVTVPLLGWRERRLRKRGVLL